MAVGMKLEWDEVELETIFFRMVGKTGACLVWKKDSLGRTWQHEVSKPYKLPCRGRMKIEI